MLRVIPHVYSWLIRYPGPTALRNNPDVRAHPSQIKLFVRIRPVRSHAMRPAGAAGGQSGKAQSFGR